MESMANEHYKPILIKNIPDKFNTYYEPFIGGAALLISLYSLNKINESIILDTNKDLYNLYKTIKKNPQQLIDELDNMKFKNNKDDYYKARELFNSINDSIERSAILIYLNRHSYNGLYRVNSNNKFKSIMDSALPNWRLLRDELNDVIY